MSVAKEVHVVGESLKLLGATPQPTWAAADCVHLFMTTVYHPLMAAANESSVQPW